VSSIIGTAEDSWCRIWVGDVGWRSQEPDTLLDPIERARADAFVRQLDRLRFVLGVALLKSAVAHEEGVTPNAVRVDRRCAMCGANHGAPRVLGSDLHVSVSHSGVRVMVAVTAVGPVGVDVEQHSVRRVMPPERMVMTSAEPVRESDDFLVYWCRKESVLKATGTGLATSLLDVVVSPANEPARLLSYQGSALMASMTDLDLGPGSTAAVTVLTREVVSYDVLSGADLL
jgi:4'-phosphopantetheinyl transferase